MILLDIVILLLILLVAGIALTLITHLFLRVPYVPTPWKVAHTMVAMADLVGDEVVYDLGAGDGRLLIVAKNRYPQLDVRGYELSPTVWLLGRLRLWLRGLTVQWHMKDFLKADLRDADCIFLYLMPGIMADLEQQLDAQLKPGTKVLSYAFQFPGRQPITTKEVPWLSGKRQLRLYRW